jgi:PAS domain S-box-containing protein
VSAGGRSSPFIQLALLGEAMQFLEDGAVFVWDDTRTYVAVNEAACRLVALPRAELLGMTVGEMSPEITDSAFERVQRDRRSVGRSTIVRTDGTRVEIEWITFHTRVAELPYIVSVCWPAA